MLILRLLLRILRPQTAPSPRKKQLPLSIILYKRLLSMLAGYYRRYAAVDTITIGKDIKVIRSRRDENFEAELKRMGFDVKSHLEEIQIHKLVKVQKPQKRKPFISYFEFKDELFVLYGDNEVLVDRTGDLELSGPADAKAKCSSITDFILRSQIHIPMRKASSVKDAVFIDEEPLEQTPAKSEEGQRTRQRPSRPTSLFGSERLPDKERIKGKEPVPAQEPAPAPAPATTKVRGIEIDNDF